MKSATATRRPSQAGRASRKTFRLTLREEPNADAAPVYIRLRRALKILGRGFGLRCMAIEEVKTGRESAKAIDAVADHC